MFNINKQTRRFQTPLGWKSHVKATGQSAGTKMLKSGLQTFFFFLPSLSGKMSPLGNMGSTPRSVRRRFYRSPVRKLTIFKRTGFVRVDVLRLGLLAPRHGATIRGKESQTNFPPLLQQILVHGKLGHGAEMRMSTQLLLSIMHCDLSRSPDS